MSKWEQTSSQRRKRLQALQAVLAPVLPSAAGEITSFCEDVGYELRAENFDDIATELAALLATGDLSEGQAGRLSGILEAFKKMIFKMLDKTKKTVVSNEDDGELGEASIGAPTPTVSIVKRPKPWNGKSKRNRRAEESLAEGQRKTPAMAFGDEEHSARQGAFKVSSYAKRLWAKEGHDIHSNLFKKEIKIMQNIPREDIPKLFGKDNMADAQDVLAGKPRKAFQMFLRKLGSVSPRAKKMVQYKSELASMYFYIVMVRVSGEMMARQIFKRYFETETDHPGELNKGKVPGWMKKARSEESVRSRVGNLVEGPLVPLTGPHGNKIPKGSDSAHLCDLIRKGLGSAIGSLFLDCRPDARFAAYGGVTVYIKFANVPASASSLDKMNASKNIHLGVDGFDAAGHAKGKVKLETLTRNGMRIRGRSGSVEQVAKSIVNGIKKAL
jgi:hypothetical protein